MPIHDPNPSVPHTFVTLPSKLAKSDMSTLHHPPPPYAGPSASLCPNLHVSSCFVILAFHSTWLGGTLPVAGIALRLLRHERLVGVVSDAFDNTEAFGPALSEEEAIPGRQILGPLHEPEGHRSSVSGPDKGAVHVDDGARLRDRPDVQHGLVLGLDGCCVRQDEHCCRVSI